MINVNYGHNQELMKACRPLEEYAFFVERIRTNQKYVDTLEEAVDKALMDMPEDSLIKSFLIANQAEVKMMCITEYDEERTLNEIKEEWLAEGMSLGLSQGIKQGLSQGKLITLIELVEEGMLTLVDAAGKAGMTVSEFEEKAGFKV